MEDKRRLLTAEEIAEELRIPKTTIYKLCNDGDIPAAKIGKHWRFDRARLDAWLVERFEAAASLDEDRKRKASKRPDDADAPPDARED